MEKKAADLSGVVRLIKIWGKKGKSFDAAFEF